MALDRQRITQVLDKHKGTLRHYGVKKLFLFGSFARNQGRARSDLDFVVAFEKKTFDAYMDLKFFLEDLFKRKVDLVIADAIKPRLRRNIVDDDIVLDVIKNKLPLLSRSVRRLLAQPAERKGKRR